MENISFFSFRLKEKAIYCLAFLLFFSAFAEALPPGGTFSLSWPINRSVIQRNSSNQAYVYFAGQFQPFGPRPDCPSYNYYYQIESLNLSDGSLKSTQIGWTQFFLQSDPNGLFYNGQTLPTGWYDLKVKATSGGVNGTQLAYTSVRFGVGDVYVIAGQSNAQGVTDNFFNSSFPSLTPYDCVSVHNYNGNCAAETDRIPTMEKLIQNVNFRVGPNGHNAWNWAVLGKLIGMHDQVPTAFFNAAGGGSTVENWRVSSDGNPTNGYNGQYCGLQGQPYLTFKNILKYYAKVFGVKAVLWHQGETDNVNGTSTASYQSDLTYLINKSRTDFGNSNLTWFVSRASYNNGIVDGDIIMAQNNVIGSMSYVNNGPESDYITTRMGDNIHIWMSGLTDLATLWRNAINGASSIQAFNAIGPPVATIVPPSPYYAKAPNGYAEYKWADWSRSYPLSSSQTADVNARCFVKDFSGNWLLTPYYISDWFCTGNFRIGAEELVQVEPEYNFMISANPVVDQSSNITFNLPKDQNVRLEIMDEKGVIVKKIADGPHAAGQYTYPIWMQNRAAGMYICVLQADGLGMTKRFMLAK